MRLGWLANRGQYLRGHCGVCSNRVRVQRRYEENLYTIIGAHSKSPSRRFYYCYRLVLKEESKYGLGRRKRRKKERSTGWIDQLAPPVLPNVTSECTTGSLLYSMGMLGSLGIRALSLATSILIAFRLESESCVPSP